MKIKTLLLLIIVLAFQLRAWKIGEFPATLYGDEQAFAWNAYNILKTGQDEYGTPYPLEFRSFDDYKSPIPVYLLVPFLWVFDMHAYSIRIPIVIASALTVFASYFLARCFFSKKQALVGAFLFAVSPWHMHLSRGFFESTLSLFFFVTGIAIYIGGQGKLSRIISSHIFFAFTVYSYFTPRILLIFFLPFLYIYSAIIMRFHTRNHALAFAVLVLLCIPLLYQSVFGNGFSRMTKLTGSMMTQVEKTVGLERTVTNLPDFWTNTLHNKATVGLRLVKNNFAEQLSIHYWYLYGDNSLRYFLGNMGMFSLLELPFFIIGLYCVLKEKKRAAFLLLGWIVLAAIPGSIVGKPFAVRSLAMLPAPFLIAGYGLFRFLQFFSYRYRYGVTGIIIVVFVFCHGLYLVKYYFEYPVYAATWWGWENKAALDYASGRESQYDNIFISDFYTGASLAYAVYTRADPLRYRTAIQNPVTIADGRHLKKIGKYYFGSLDIDKRRMQENIIPPRSLYIARPEEAESSQVIRAPDDGRILFYIYTTD